MALSLTTGSQFADSQPLQRRTALVVVFSRTSGRRRCADIVEYGACAVMPSLLTGDVFPVGC